MNSPAPRAGGEPVSDLMLKVLRWVSNAREGASINAALYADPLAKCLIAGLLRIDGTMSRAAISLTDKGVALLEEAP
jgi:hypothetical protein